MKPISPLLLLLCSLALTESKVFEKCQLAEIFAENFPKDQVNDWLCLAHHESRYNSSAVGNQNPDGSRDLGLFQISEKWWCKWDKVSIVACDVTCNKFLDNDLDDDIRCVKKIFKEHQKLQGNGFKAWVAWSARCQGDLQSFSQGCPAMTEASQREDKNPLSPNFKPGIIAPAEQRKPE